MFNEGYLAISFEALLGLIVTVVSVWLVVKQLRETKLASQMEGLLALADQLADVAELRETLVPAITSNDWDQLSDEEAHTRVYGSEAHKIAYKKTKNFYELIGVLVRRKALDRGLASDYFGNSIAIWWERLEKVTRQESKDLGYNVGSHWEWVAREFE